MFLKRNLKIWGQKKIRKIDLDGTQIFLPMQMSMNWCGFFDVISLMIYFLFPFSFVTDVVASMAGIQVQPGDILVSYIFMFYIF